MDPLRSAAGPGKATEIPCQDSPYTFLYPLPQKKIPREKIPPQVH